MPHYAFLNGTSYEARVISFNQAASNELQNIANQNNKICVNPLSLNIFSSVCVVHLL